MENEKLGIDNLLTVGDFACNMANDVIASLEDGKINFADAPRFVDNLFSLPKTLKAVPMLDDEFLDIDPEEQAIFEARIAEKLALPEGASKEIVKAVVTVIMRSASMTKAVMGLVDAIKAAK